MDCKECGAPTPLHNAGCLRGELDDCRRMRIAWQQKADAEIARLCAELAGMRAAFAAEQQVSQTFAKTWGEDVARLRAELAASERDYLAAPALRAELAAAERERKFQNFRADSAEAGWAIDRRVLKSTMDELDAARQHAERLREALQDCAEALASMRDRFGMCGEGDGKDRKADADYYSGSLPALIRARDALQGDRQDAERMLRKAIDVTWGYALEDGSVPSTKIQDKIIATVRAAPGATPAAISSIDFHQRKGRASDIISEALLAYDQWMLDDNYDATSALRDIMTRMKNRAAQAAHDE